MTNKEKIHVLLAEASRCFADDNKEAGYRKFEAIEFLLQEGEMVMPNELKGHVISMTEVSKYGFIKGEDNVDYFFHQDDFHGFWNDLVNDYHNAPNPNIPVTFIKGEPTEKGPRANDVKRTDFPNQAV